MTYQITLRNQIKSLEYCFYFALLIIFCSIYFFNGEYKYDVIYGSMFFFIIFNVSTFYLHFEYLYYNKNYVVVVDSYQKTLTIGTKKENTDTKVFQFS